MLREQGKEGTKGKKMTERCRGGNGKQRKYLLGQGGYRRGGVEIHWMEETRRESEGGAKS